MKVWTKKMTESNSKGPIIYNTEDPKKEFKPDKQWVVFRIRPEHAIVFVDSTVQLMQDGLLQLYLPVGQHTYQVISPFYENKKETKF